MGHPPGSGTGRTRTDPVIRGPGFRARVIHAPAAFAPKVKPKSSGTSSKTTGASSMNMNRRLSVRLSVATSASAQES